MPEQVIQNKWDPTDHFVKMGMSREEVEAWVKSRHSTDSLEETLGKGENNGVRRSIQPVLTLTKLRASMLIRLGLWRLFPITVCIFDFIIRIIALQLRHLTLASISAIEFCCLSVMLSVKPVYTS